MKTAIITGASKGIGKATAISLAEQGHTVYALARSGDLLDSLAGRKTEGRIIPVTADLSGDKGIKELEKTLNDTSSVDILIHNAGVLVNKPFMETTMDDWQLQLDINLLAMVRLTKSLKPKMTKNSHIITISSMGGFQGSSKFPGLAAYSASKGAASILTECLSTEFARDQIAVNCLCLGAVQTEMLEQAFPGYEAPVSPDEMGSFIADFSLNAHRFINGRIIPIALNNPG